jgi:hypothetical protein
MKKNKGFIVPLLLGIIVLLVIGGGIYIYQNKKAQQSSQVQQPANTSNVSTDISNWKTYTFAALTFQYPSDWQVHTDNDLGGAIITPPSPKDQNDNIILQLKQSNCDAHFPKCNFIETSGGAVYDLHTYSTNPKTLNIYATILASIKETNGAVPAILPQPKA